MKEHDFAGALECLESTMATMSKMPEAAVIWIDGFKDEIRHALTLAKRMQDEGLVLCHERVHLPAVAGDRACSGLKSIMCQLRDCFAEDRAEYGEQLLNELPAALTPPDNAEQLREVRSAVVRMIEACEADSHPNDWRTAGDGTPLGDLRKSLAILDSMMKREGV